MEVANPPSPVRLGLMAWNRLIRTPGCETLRSPGSAARGAVRRQRAAPAAGRSHLVETTFAGTGMIRHMQRARAAHYRVGLHFISLDSPDQALSRVRVALGGHPVPDIDVRRRFQRSYAQLPAAIRTTDEVHFYDNTDPDQPQDQPHREIGLI